MTDRPDIDREEKRVADDIEAAIPTASSIEAEMMLEAADIEELEFHEEPPAER
jgi:hypothetical protein